MRREVFVGLCTVLILAAYADTASFTRQVPAEDRIRQALNRLTFGQRPGDVEQVKLLGLKKWVDLQLHPDRIPENPILIEKLKPFDTLTMSSKELVRNYPAPQIVKQMVAGQIPFPSDPDRRLLIQKLVKRDEAKQGDAATPPPDAHHPRETRRHSAAQRTPLATHRKAAGPPRRPAGDVA
ncbi:MAG: DUF1800 family protein [Ignavibacteriota bacterium]